MNEERRKILQVVIDSLQYVIDEEQAAHDNMPENIQNSDKGDKIIEGLHELIDAKDILEETMADESYIYGD